MVRSLRLPLPLALPSAPPPKGVNCCRDKVRPALSRHPVGASPFMEIGMTDEEKAAAKLADDQKLKESQAAKDAQVAKEQ